MSSRRLLLGLAVMLLFGGVLFGEGKQEQEAQSLTISVPWSGQELDQFLPVLQAFEEREGVDVNYVTYRGEDLASILPAQFQAGQTPADVIFMWEWWVQQNAQFAEDLSGVWGENTDAFVADAIEAEGKVVALPYYMVAKPGFWYRRSFFEQNNLSEPTTWDEFTQLLQTIGEIEGIDAPIVTGNGVGWPMSDVTEHFLIRFGGPELQRGLMSGEVSWTDPSVRQVFEERLIPLLEAGAFSDPIEWTQAVELWWSGDYALYFQGNFITGMVEDPTDLGVFALPVEGGTLGAAAPPQAIVTGPDYAFIPTASENAELARSLLEFMLSEEGQRIRAEQGGKLVVRNDIPASAYPEADQAVAEVVSDVEETVSDLDDTIGGDWQRVFWDQLKLLWVRPGSLDDVLTALEEAMPETPTRAAN